MFSAILFYWFAITLVIFVVMLVEYKRSFGEVTVLEFIIMFIASQVPVFNVFVTVLCLFRIASRSKFFSKKLF